MFDITEHSRTQDFAGSLSDSFRAEHDTLKKKIIYEQPLNERVRAWLRLEHLFAQASYHMKGVSSWDSRAALSGIIEILEFINRNDLKPDLIKELERHTQMYQNLRSIPGVDAERLQVVLDKLDDALTSLIKQETQPGKELLENFLIGTVQQRSSIPGGTCRFDLPIYHYWLQRNLKQRQSDLMDWFQSLEFLRSAIDVNLYLIRNNASSSQERAENGFFQAKLDAHSDYQIIRAALPEDHNYYPEISGGRHRFTIRFFEFQGDCRATQTERDIDFELCCCML